MQHLPFSAATVGSMRVKLDSVQGRPSWLVRCETPKHTKRFKGRLANSLSPAPGSEGSHGLQNLFLLLLLPPPLLFFSNILLGIRHSPWKHSKLSCVQEWGGGHSFTLTRPMRKDGSGGHFKYMALLCMAFFILSVHT